VNSSSVLPIRKIHFSEEVHARCINRSIASGFDDARQLKVSGAHRAFDVAIM